MKELTVTFRIPEPGDTLPFTVWEKDGDFIEYDIYGDMSTNVTGAKGLMKDFGVAMAVRYAITSEVSE